MTRQVLVKRYADLCALVKVYLEPIGLQRGCDAFVEIIVRIGCGKLVYDSCLKNLGIKCFPGSGNTPEDYNDSGD